MNLDWHTVRAVLDRAAPYWKRYRLLLLAGLVTAAGLGIWATSEDTSVRGEPLGPLSREVSLHGLGQVTVPAAWRLEEGVWAHRGRGGDVPGLFRNLTALENSLDGDKVTFLFRANPIDDTDEGQLTLTLFRRGAPPADAAGYRALLGGGPAECRYLAAPADSVAGCLAARGAGVAEKLAEIVATVRKHDARFSKFFRAADEFASLAERNLAVTRQYLASLGLPPVAVGSPAVRGAERVFLEVETSDQPETWLHWVESLGDVDAQAGARLAQQAGQKSPGLDRLVVLQWQADRGVWAPAESSYLTAAEVAASGMDFAALDRARAYLFHAESYILEEGAVDAARREAQGRSAAATRQAVAKLVRSR